jgi:hypothetical protein
MECCAKWAGSLTKGSFTRSSINVKTLCHTRDDNCRPRCLPGPAVRAKQPHIRHFYLCLGQKRIFSMRLLASSSALGDIEKPQGTAIKIAQRLCC